MRSLVKLGLIGLVALAAASQPLKISRTEVDEPRLQQLAPYAWRVPERRDFQAIDRWAERAPAEVEKSLLPLAAYLKRAGSDEVSQNRAIFWWLAERMEYGETTRDGRYDAATLLRTRRGTCNGFSILYVALAQAMGLEAEKLKGHVLVAPEEVGLHAWVRVRIGERWALVEPTWAHCVPRSERERYFLADPRDFLLEHLPTDPHWQLLTPPLSQAGFRKWGKPVQGAAGLYFQIVPAKKG